MENFFSHVQSEYEFGNGCCTLVVGRNLDKGGNNGAGKTTLFEAITVALTGKSLRDLKKESFINDDAEDCKIILDLTNPVLKQTLTITRQFFRGNKSSRVELVEDGELNTHIVSVAEADKRILELIGISRDDLLRYYIISQDNTYTFFTAADNEKKEILNRITSADMINPILDKLSEDKRGLEKEVSEIDKQISTFETRKETYKEQLEELHSNDDKAEEIKDLKERIKALETKKARLIESLKVVDQNITKITKQKAEIQLPDVTKAIKMVESSERSIEENERNKRENLKIIKMAELDLSGSVECPKCGEEFIPQSQLNLSPKETRQLIKDAKMQNKEIDKAIENLNKKIDTCNEKIAEREQLEEQIAKCDKQLKIWRMEKSDKADEITSLENKIKRCNNEIKEIKDQNGNAAAIKSLENKIKSCDKSLSELAESRKPVSEELEEANYWNYYMGKSGFKTYLANSAIKVIEGTVNSYLQKFRSDISVNINGFTVLRDGTVREKIDIYALEDGLNPKPYMGRSGGERSRIKLAGILAIQHLINMSLDGRGLDMIILDESMAGMDSEGTMEFVNILNNVGTTIMMITQNVEDASIFENVLTVEKSDGVSKYV